MDDFILSKIENLLENILNILLTKTFNENITIENQYIRLFRCTKNTNFET